MRLPVSALFMGAFFFSLTAAADPPEAPASAGGAVAPMRADIVARVQDATRSRTSTAAGKPQELAVSARVVTAQNTSRPIATPRTLRRMNPDQFVRSVDLQPCADEQGAAVPTNIVVQIDVGPAADLEQVEVLSGASGALCACVAKQLEKGRFGAPSGSGARVTLRLTVPVAVKPPPSPKESNAQSPPVTVTATKAEAGDR